MKKKFFYIFILGATLVVVALLIWEPKTERVMIDTWPDSEGEYSRADHRKQEESVERYGILRTASTSGDLTFTYYDINAGKVLTESQGYPWFFATVEDIENPQRVTDYYQYTQNHKGSIFKIIGKKGEDDCEYYNNGVCLENISVEKIEAFKWESNQLLPLTP